MENYLNKKLKIKNGDKISILNPPDNYLNKIEENGSIGVSNKLENGMDLIQLFVSSRKDLNTQLPACIKSLKDGGILWVSYPKKSAKVKTDLSRDSGWDILKELNYRPVSLISVDETWSALRLKPTDKVKTKKDVSNKYINKEKRTVMLPEDLKKELGKHKKIREAFDKLSFTNKKEYVVWIIESKKEETRVRRIKSLIKKIGDSKTS